MAATQNKNYYATLGVKKTATQDNIRPGEPHAQPKKGGSLSVLRERPNTPARPLK
jgi:hypothetical protein